MATKAIYQHHERTTSANLEADLQLRESGIDPQVNGVTVRGETDATFYHLLTKEHTAPSFDSTLTLSSALTIAGTITASNLTASLPVFTDGSKVFVSNAITGTGNVVMSASPTFTGTITAAALTLSGNATVGGTLGVTGASTFTPLVGTGTRLVTSTSAGVLGNATTISGGYGWTGNHSFQGRVDFSGFGTAATGAMYRTAANGLQLRGVTGSSYDFALESAAGSNLLLNPTGTTGLTFPGANGVTITNSLTLSTLSSGRIPVVSTAGLITQDNLYWDATNDRLGVGNSASSPAVDVDVVSSYVGGSTTIRVSNPDNTNTVSHARLVLTSGGASGGDAFTQYTVSGVTNWAAGVDNSDADAFVITPASTLGSATNGLRISTAGAVTIPGTLGVTGAATLSTLSSGRIPVVSTAGLITQDNLYWDATNDRLGIGSGATSPSSTVHAAASSAGANIQITAQNSDNTNTSSHARFLATSGGSASGDGYYTSSTGVTDWSFGGDNTDGDAFVLSENSTLGTNNRFRVSSTQFRAYGNLQVDGTATVTGASTLAALSATTGTFSGTLTADGNAVFNGEVRVPYGLIYTTNASGNLQIAGGNTPANGGVITLYGVSGGNSITLAAGGGTAVTIGGESVAISKALILDAVTTVGAGGSDWTNETSISTTNTNHVKITPTGESQTYRLIDGSTDQVVLVTNLHTTNSIYVDLYDGSGSSLVYMNPGRTVVMWYSGTRWYSSYA